MRIKRNASIGVEKIELGNKKVEEGWEILVA
jgi:hypothetical protein